MRNKSKLGRIVIHLFLILLSLTFVIPIIIVISMSLSSEEAIMLHGYSVFPRAVDLGAYQYVFRNPGIILDAYKVTLFVSLTGTLVSVFIMMMCGYSLSRRCFKIRSAVNFYLFFTLLFNGGMVPKYIVVTQYLHLQNTLWILILSLLVNVWYIYIFRTFMQDIPEAVIESAMLDSAGEFTIFFRIVAPLCKPAIATVGLFVLLSYWNEWTTALLYIDDEKKYPLQYLLQKILQNIQNVMQNMNRAPIGATDATKMPTETVRMALAVVATGPMLVIMPFFQKYFVRGMTLGSVKG